MKKKLAGAIYLLLFLALCLSAAATMPFIKQDGAAEKRTLAAFPSLRDENGALQLTAIPGQFEAWLDDHVGLRTLWTQQYARLHAALGASSNDSVVVGRDGWLYFEPTLPDYTGVDALDENQRYRAKLALETIDRALDVPLVVFFAPNKNTVAPEAMPAAYPRAEEAHAIGWLIENADVNIIDSVPALTGEGLYHATDTHWNNRGARIGAGLIINAVNQLTGADGAAPDPNADYTLEPYTGDLGQMLFPNNPPADVQLAYADAAQNFDFAGRYRTPEDMTITTEGSGAPLKLLMLRDSFTNLLIEPISNAYSDVQYRRAMPFPLSDAGEYDAVVLEMVERRIGELLTAAPVIPAPESEPWTETESGCAAEAVFIQEKDRVLITGRTDKAVDRLTQLNVAVTDRGQTAYYEAFPSGEHGDGSFSLYVESLAEGAEIQVFMAGEETLLSEKTPVLPAE